MDASLYEPINVFKPMGPDVGIVDGPVEHLTVGGIRLPMPFTTRMTVMRLSNGDLLPHSPIKIDQALASELERMGTSDIWCLPTSFTTRISGSGRKPSPVRSPSGHQLDRMQEVLDGHLFNSADWRLARALLANFDPKPDAILLRREAAPSKLAELIGVSRTHVHRLINQFQLAGLMTRVSDGLYDLHREQLEQFSNQ